MINHNWDGFNCHLSRPDKKIKRCVIGKLDLVDDCCGVWVDFQINGKKQTKRVSPILLASVNTSWFDNSVCSEDDEDDETYEFSVLPPIKPLPIWSIDNIEHFVPSKKIACVQWHVDQVNQLIALSQ